MAKLSIETLRAHLSRIRMLVLDVDGVLTDGSIYVLDNGEEFKRFNVKDGLGMRRALQAGIEVAVITANSSVAVKHRMAKLGIRYVFTGVEAKEVILADLCQMLDIQTDDVAYMGDDLTDLKVMKMVGLPITVSDAVSSIKTVAHYVTNCNGGQGAVREICDLLLEEN